MNLKNLEIMQEMKNREMKKTSNDEEATIEELAEEGKESEKENQVF